MVIINHETFLSDPSPIIWIPLLLTDWLTNCCLVNLIDVTLACEDANSKLAEAVPVADVDAEDHVGNSLLQIWELRFGHKAKFYSDLQFGWEFELKSGKISKPEFGYFAVDILLR